MVFKGDFDEMEYKREEKEGFDRRKGDFQGKMMEWVKRRKREALKHSFIPTGCLEGFLSEDNSEMGSFGHEAQ